MLSSGSQKYPPTERTQTASDLEIGSDSEQVSKRGIETLGEDSPGPLPSDERNSTSEKERDSLLDRLRATGMPQTAGSPSGKAEGTIITMDSEPSFENDLASAPESAHTDNASEDPTQSARRVKRRLDHEDEPTDEDAPRKSSTLQTVDGDSVMTEATDLASSEPPPVVIREVSNEGSDGAGGSLPPQSSNAEDLPATKAVEDTHNASPAPSSGEPSSSHPSPASSKKRRKAKEIEPSEASPARQTRSRARAANAASTSTTPASTGAATVPSQAPAVATQSTSEAPSAPAATPSIDPAIDPSLTASNPSDKSPSADAGTSNASQSSTNGAAGSNASTPSNGVNPYLSLFFPKSNPNGGTPTPTSATSMPFANPYMFYPMTPVTPNSPGYPYNPYLYMGPMMPGYHHPGAPQSSATSPATPSSSTQAGPSQLPQAPQPPAPPGPKPKRTKAHPVSSKSFSIPLVPRDKQGKPMLPLNVGIMTVISLGSVCPREHFHTERYIFPVGYEVTRRYLSTINPSIEVVYHCTILDGGDGPKFQIVPSDTPDKPVIAGTATGAWSSIVKQANAIRNRQHSNSVSGPDFFGLGQNTIKHLIQELPGADKLKSYVWQYFIEGGPLGGRHASVIPALPEEYDASIPRGPVYHTPIEREKLKMMDGNASPGEMPKGLSHYPQHIIAQAHSGHIQAGPSHSPLQTQAPPPPPPPAIPSGPMPTAGMPTIPSIMAVNPGNLPHMSSPCPVGGAQSESPPPHVSLAPPAQTSAQRKSALAQVEQIQAQVQAVHTQAQQAPSSNGNGHPATFIPVVGQPTPITPNTPAPSIASIMNTYRPAAS